jgi:4-hydroxy-3-methylbut-2-enyl diphosphate reductase
LLREVARKRGVAAYMVDNAGELRPEWVTGRQRVGITAGASAPDVLVQQVIDKLKALGAERVTPLKGIEERVIFPLPKSLV